MFLCNGKGNAPFVDVSSYIKPIAYNDSSIQYLGRWVDTGSGKWSGWSSSQAVFTVTNASYVNVVCSVVDANSSDYCIVEYAIDNSASELVILTLSSVAGIYTGTAIATIPIPDSGAHTVTVQPMGAYASQYAATNKVTITGYQIAGDAELSTWTQGTVNLQVIGDSWTAAYNGWARLLDRSHFKLTITATPGFQLSDMMPKYNYIYSGVVDTTDPTFDGIVIVLGANDAMAGVSTTTFKTNMLSFIDTIRLRQPTAKIILVRCPPNGTRDFSIYGTVLSQIPALRSNVLYWDTSSLDATLSTMWLDQAHLNSSGKIVIASALNTYLTTTAGL